MKNGFFAKNDIEQSIPNNASIRSSSHSTNFSYKNSRNQLRAIQMNKQDYGQIEPNTTSEMIPECCNLISSLTVSSLQNEADHKEFVFNKSSSFSAKSYKKYVSDDLKEFFLNKSKKWQNYRQNLVDTHCHFDMMFSKLKRKLLIVK